MIIIINILINRHYQCVFSSAIKVFLGILSILAVGSVSVYLSVPTVCSQPPIPSRGRLSISVPTSFPHYAAYNQTTKIPAGAVASYRCTSGYSLKGSEEKTCLENGAWVP